MQIRLKRPPYRRESRMELLDAACMVRRQLGRYRVKDEDRVTAELIYLRAWQRKVLLDLYADYRRRLVTQELQ